MFNHFGNHALGMNEKIQVGWWNVVHIYNFASKYITLNPFKLPIYTEPRYVNGLG
jgi:hypothetical protein